MGGRLLIVTALLVFAIGLLSACAQNPSAEGVDASAAKAEAQGNAEQPSEEPTLVEDPTPMPERTMATAAESDIGILAGGEPPPEYQVKKDGTLIIGGDVVVRCADLLKVDPQVGNPSPNVVRQLRQARKEHVEVCTKAGFPPDTGTRKRSVANHPQEPMVKRSRPGLLTGVITDVEDDRILVEEDPEAGCRRKKAPMGPCSPKMWFAIEKSTRVIREEGGDPTTAKASDLKEGQRVSADYTGYDVAESYPSQTSARTVTILGPS